MNNMEITILEKPQYTILYYSSHLSFLSFLYAICKEKYIISLCPGVIFITSINYWRWPTYSWRRYIDMTAVIASLIYQSYIAYTAKDGNTYYILTGVALLTFPFSKYYYMKKQLWISTYLHVMLHILANIANIYLYASDSPKV